MTSLYSGSSQCDSESSNFFSVVYFLVISKDLSAILISMTLKCVSLKSSLLESMLAFPPHTYHIVELFNKNPWVLFPHIHAPSFLSSWAQKWKRKSLSHIWLCNPVDYSRPDSVHGILQAILEWVAIPFSRVPSQPRDSTWVSCIEGRFFTVWSPREALLSPNPSVNTCQSENPRPQMAPVVPAPMIPNLDLILDAIAVLIFLINGILIS